MYEKCASTFGVFGLGRVHFTKFSLSPSFSYTFPHKGDVVYPTSVRGEPLSLHVFYILFFFLSLYLGCIYRVFTYLEHSLHVVYWPGIVLLFLVSDRTFLISAGLPHGNLETFFIFYL